MDPEIKNFADIVRLIKEDPARANTLVADWQKFEEQNEDTLPTNEDLLLGRDIGIVLNDLRDEDEDKQTQTNGQVDPSSFLTQFATLTALSLALHKGKKTFEEDKDYQELVKKHKELWLEKNNAKNFNSKEGLDYIYGSLEDEGEGAPTLKKDAEQEFRNDPKFKKRVKRYDNEKKKVYKNLNEDPNVINRSYEIENHTASRLAYLKTHEDTRTSEEMSALIKKRSWERFVTENPEKAKTYAQTNADIKKAHEKQEIKKQLAEIEQQTGRQVRYVEKIHNKPDDITVEDASRRLESIISPPPRSILSEHRATVSQTERFVGRGENVEISGTRRQFRPQARRVTSLGRQGTKLAARAGMAAGRTVVGWLMSNPMGLLAIGLPVLLIIIVFIIIMLEGGGGGFFQKGVATTECIDADGNIIIVTNGNTCAINLTGYYTNTEGETVTAVCRDKCTDFVRNSCDRNVSNTCDFPLSACGAPSTGFCYEYTPPNDALDRYRDCITGGDGYDGTALGVTSCSGGIADPTITPTPTVIATPTPTRTPTPTPTGAPSNFSCTQVIGYSQVGHQMPPNADWGWFYAGGFFESIVGNSNWQLIWQNGGGVQYWRNPSASGWNGTRHSPCLTNSATPDRVLYSVTWDIYQTDVQAWVNEIEIVLANIRTNIPSARQIILQAVVGGPNHQICGSGSGVRASFNHPYIDQAIAIVAARYTDVVEGFSPEVRTCADYTDNTGHLTLDGASAVAQTIGNFNRP